MHNKTLILRWLQILLVALLFGISLYPYLGGPILPIIVISLPLGFVTWLGINLVFDSFHRWAEARLIRAALEGQRVFDGKRRAVLGKIYPHYEPITAPFSGRECLIVIYDIYHEYYKKTQSGSTLSEPIIYSGYHLAPSEIHTGDEKVKILGFPDISDVPEQETTSYGKIRSFIEKTDFTPQLKGSFMEGVNDLATVIRLDENGAAAEDYQFRDLVPEQMIKSREQVVKKGTDVCLIGVFDAARGAIVPSKFRLRRNMRLIPGTGEQISSSLNKNAGVVVCFGLFVSLLCISVGLLPHAPDALLERLPAGEKLRQFRNEQLRSFDKEWRPEKFQQRLAEEAKEEAKKRERENAALELRSTEVKAAIQQGDVNWLKKELSKGLDPNMRLLAGQNSSRPLIEAIFAGQSAITQLLLDAGADVNESLPFAVYHGDLEAVQFLFDNGAKSSYAGATPELCPFGFPIINQDVDMLVLLLEASTEPPPPNCDDYLEVLSTDGDKPAKIRELIRKARESRGAE